MPALSRLSRASEPWVSYSSRWNGWLTSRTAREQAEEYLFELVSESDGSQPIAFFVLAHGYEEEDPSTKRVQ